MNEPTLATRTSSRAGTRWWWLVLLFTVIGGTVGYEVSSSSAPVYQATTSILVGDSLVAPNVSKDEIEASQLVASTYADLVRGQSVLEGVKQTLGLPESWRQLQSQVHVNLGQNSAQLMLISVDGDSPAQARTIAQAVADELIALSPTSTSAGTAATEFVVVRLHALQRQISTGQQRVATLQQRLNATADPAAAPPLRARIDSLQKLIIAWQSNYSSLAGLAATQRSTPNHLRVLQAAQADPNPIHRQIRIDTAMATAIGFLLGLGLAYVLEGRRTRKRRSLTTFDDPPVDRYGEPWAAPRKERRERSAEGRGKAGELDTGAGENDPAEEVSRA